MKSLVELKRLYSEWRIKLQRVQAVLQPPTWSTEEWNNFAKVVATVVRQHGKTWEDGGTNFWDIRWETQDQGELVCQVEEIPNQKHSLVVAQYGGFADGTENYIWFYCEFTETGGFLGDPYWVEGNWKDALAMVLMPQQMSTSFYLAEGSSSANLKSNLLLAESAS